MKDCLFCRFATGAMPTDLIWSDDEFVAFRDIAPKAPVHVLVIPKGAYVSWDDFHERASDAEQAALSRAVGKVARLMGVAEGGYRVICNVGRDGHQEVPHLHLHVLGGRALGRMIGKAD